MVGRSQQRLSQFEGVDQLSLPCNVVPSGSNILEICDIRNNLIIMKTEATESSSGDGVGGDTMPNLRIFNGTYYIYLYISLVLLIILVCLKGCLVYSAKKKQRRDTG